MTYRAGHRNDRIIIMEEILLIFILLSYKQQKKTRRTRLLRALRDDSDPFALQNSIFKQFFRFSKHQASKLIEELEPHYNQRSLIPFPFTFLSVLYFLAHGSYQKCVGNNYVFPVSQSTVCRAIDKITTLIIKVKSSEITFPRSSEEKLIKKFGFYEKFGIKGTIGAIDCTHVAIISPHIGDLQTPAHVYLNRKNYHSINVEAICDHKMRFLAVNAKFPGSCHDSGIWATSSVRLHLMQTHNACSFTWLLGDSGYPLEPWLLTPLANPSSAAERRYNSMQIAARNVIERAFGVLKSRFRCLHRNRVLHYSHKKAAKIIYACAILHNILLQGHLDEDFEVETEDNNNENSRIDVPSDAVVTESQREGQRIRQAYINTLFVEHAN